MRALSTAAALCGLGLLGSCSGGSADDAEAVPDLAALRVDEPLPVAGSRAAAALGSNSQDVGRGAAAGEPNARERPDARLVYRRALDEARATLEAKDARAKLDKIEAFIEREKDLMR